MECGAVIEKMIAVRWIVIAITGETDGKSEERNAEKRDARKKERTEEKIEETVAVPLKNAEEVISLFTDEVTILAEEMMIVTSVIDGEKPVAVNLSRNRSIDTYQ